MTSARDRQQPRHQPARLGGIRGPAEQGVEVQRRDDELEQLVDGGRALAPRRRPSAVTGWRTARGRLRARPKIEAQGGCGWRSPLGAIDLALEGEKRSPASLRSAAAVLARPQAFDDQGSRALVDEISRLVLRYLVD